MKKHYILYLLVISSLISARPGMKTAAALLPKSSWYKRDPNPPLITAIMEGNIPEVTRLLEEGADPNERNSTTGSPLFFATNKKDPIITQLLLKHGANPNAISMTKNLSPWRELDNAIAFGTEEHIKLLLKYDTDPFQLRENHKKASPSGLKQTQQNIILVQAERMKRVTTLLLCLKKESWDNLPYLPAEVSEMIKGAVQEICTK